LRSVQVPGADSLPSPADTVSLGFDFVERVLASQRKFVEELTAIQSSGATETGITSKPKAAASSK
jgi:hypothetical protein